MIQHLKQFLAAFIILISFFGANAQSITLLQDGKKSSLRGLCVVNDSVAWASGSNGSIALTLDGGETWIWRQVKDFEKADFRDIEAFSNKEAIIIASGTPAVILKTIDGGINWQLVYRNNNEAYFLDAMDFSNPNHGWVQGDPVNGKFLLIETINGGKTWVERQDIAPIALAGEAAFAASGTCFRVNKKKMYLVTGGSKSRIISANIDSYNWEYQNIPLLQAKDSRGAFSISIGKKEKVLVGGDYQDKKTDSIACIMKGGKFKFPVKSTSGYQSCVEYINNSRYISTGTSGTNITLNSGNTWHQTDSVSFNVCRKAKQGNLVLLAGNNGKIAILNP